MSRKSNNTCFKVILAHLSTAPVLLTLLILLLPNISYSQSVSGDITVVVIDESENIRSSLLDDFQTGLEELAAEYGAFTVSSYDEVKRELSTVYQRALDVCRGAPGCLQDILQNTTLVGVLVARIDQDRNEYHIELSLLSLVDPDSQETGEAVNLSESTTSDLNNQMFLLVPIFELLESLENSATTSSDASTARVTTVTTPNEHPTYEGTPAYPSYSDSTDQERTEEREADTEAVSDESSQWHYPDPVLSQSMESRERNVLASSLTICGAVFAVGGLTLWSWADNIQAEIQSTPHERDELMAFQEQGNAVLTAGNVFFLSGLSALITGVIFHLTDIGRDTDESDSSFDDWSGFSIQPTRGGSTLQIQVDY